LIWSAIKNLNIKDRENLRVYNGEFVKVFEAYKSGGISKDALFEIFKKIAAGCSETIDQLILNYGLVDIKSPEVQTTIKSLIEETSDGVFRDNVKRIEFICGQVKNKYANRLDGASLYREISQKASQ